MSQSSETAAKREEALRELSAEDRAWLQTTLETYRGLLDFLHEN